MELEHESRSAGPLETRPDRIGTSSARSETPARDAGGKNSESADESRESPSLSSSLVDELRVDEHDHVDAREAATVSGESSSTSEQPHSTLSGYDLTRKTAAQGMPSPPPQTMERPRGFEGSEPETPEEWNVVSDESLFSIRVGSSSFSGDHVVSFNELPESEDLAGDSALAEDDKATAEPSAADLTQKLESNSSSHSLVSDGSEASKLSFAFPILPGSVSTEPVMPEIDRARAPTPSPPAKASKPTSADHWFPCSSYCSCWSWCQWPRNCCHCSFRRHCCCLCCCF